VLRGQRTQQETRLRMAFLRTRACSTSFAQVRGVHCTVERFEIEDCTTPSRDTMQGIQNAIDLAIAEERTPYVWF
jgi:hypothetical protein